MTKPSLVLHKKSSNLRYTVEQTASRFSFHVSAYGVGVRVGVTVVVLVPVTVAVIVVVPLVPVGVAVRVPTVAWALLWAVGIPWAVDVGEPLVGTDAVATVVPPGTRAVGVWVAAGGGGGAPTSEAGKSLLTSLPKLSYSTARS